ncbi:hypothetical protein Tco_0061850, partial [Tanacetum coccineum]
VNPNRCKRLGKGIANLDTHFNTLVESVGLVLLAFARVVELDHFTILVYENVSEIDLYLLARV